MMKYFYLLLALCTILWNALSLTYIADKYYQLGFLERGNGLPAEWVKLPVGVCLTKKGDC